MGRIALQRLLALSLLGCLSAHAASPVWAVRGVHHTVYLAGSVHLLPAADAALPRGFEHAYADSARLVMELDLSKLDPLQAASWMSAHGALAPDATLRGVLGEPRYTRVSAAAAELGVPLELLEQQAPWVIGIELADVEYLHLGFDPERGVEQQLLQRAQRDGKPISGLETLDEELGALEALSAADQLKLLDQTLGELKDTDSAMHEVLGAWRRGDARGLATLLGHEYQSFPALYRPLVTTRNQRWLPQIEALLAAEGNVLVVVGALHLVGDGGVLELLRRDGHPATQLE